MNEYKFTVILSIYYKTTLDEIKRALLSLKNQKLKPNEIIIVFDGPCSLRVIFYVKFFLNIFQLFLSISSSDSKNLQK